MREQHLHQHSLLENERPRMVPLRIKDQYEPVPRVVQLPEGLVSWYDKLAAEKHCRACLRSVEVRPLTRHHLVPQAWWLRRGVAFARYRNVAANIIPLCRPCHDEVEQSTEARRMLRRVLTQQEVALAVALRGIEWLEIVYPR